MQVGAITLPAGKISTAFLKANWSTIISGPLLQLLPVDWVMEELNLSQADAIKWLKDPNNWKRGYKGKLDDENQEGLGLGALVKDRILRMYWTDTFADGMDLNFVSEPKDASLLSIHLHSD
jgi:hypothetical protein